MPNAKINGADIDVGVEVENGVPMVFVIKHGPAPAEIKLDPEQVAFVADQFRHLPPAKADPRPEGVYVSQFTYPEGSGPDGRQFAKIERVDGNGAVHSLSLVQDEAVAAAWDIEDMFK
jgi:hypothetical protein